MSRFIHIMDLVNLPMLANDDILMRDKGKLLTFSQYLYNDMNLSTLRIARRMSFEINKRTGTVDLPKNTLQLCSVSVDIHGVLWPVYRNDRLHKDLVDVSAKKDCSCEKNCSYQLCNTIKGYEAVTSVKSDVNPDGSAVSFTCVDRKAVDDQGYFIQVLQYPKRIYTNGVWTSTQMVTESKKLCKVEVDANGCVCDTEENLKNICQNSGLTNEVFSSCLSVGGIPIGGTSSTPPAPGISKWIFHRNVAMDWLGVQGGCLLPDYFNNIYNIDELGNRLIFPSNFGFNKVVVRLYTSVDLKDMYIPMIAAPVFVTGLKWYQYRWKDDLNSQKLAEVYEHKFSQQNWALLGELNKYTIKEMGSMIAPQVFMPSFLNQYGRA